MPLATPTGRTHARPRSCPRAPVRAARADVALLCMTLALAATVGCDPPQGVACSLELRPRAVPQRVVRQELLSFEPPTGSTLSADEAVVDALRRCAQQAAAIVGDKEQWTCACGDEPVPSVFDAPW